MKSVHFRSQNNTKPFLAKTKITNNTKKLHAKSEIHRQDEDVSKTDSFPEWVPKRNWHQYLSGDHGPPSLQPPPATLEPIPLPTVHFCSAEKDYSIPKCVPSITDLCDQDKRKIGLLVEEIARCKQEKSEDEECILKLKSKISKLKSALKSLEEEQQSGLEMLKSVKLQHCKEQSALKEQLGELNKLLAEMQTQKAASESKTLRIASQAEKMTQAIHLLHQENLRLKDEVATAKDRLGAAQLAVEKMTKDLQDVQERMKPLTDEKACQSTEDIVTERLYIKTTDKSNKAQRDQELLSELFFNKAVQNNLSSRETIIFLPADTKLPFTHF